MADLPMGLQLTANEQEVGEWSLSGRKIVLTSRRLIVNDGSGGMAVLRLAHVSAIQTVTVDNPGRRAWGTLLILFGVLGIALAYYLSGQNAYGNSPAGVSAISGIVVGIIGIALVLAAKTTLLCVVSASGERATIAPSGYLQDQTVRKIVAEVGDALAMSPNEEWAPAPEVSG